MEISTTLTEWWSCTFLSKESQDRSGSGFSRSILTSDPVKNKSEKAQQSEVSAFSACIPIFPCTPKKKTSQRERRFCDSCQKTQSVFPFNHSRRLETIFARTNVTKNWGNCPLILRHFTSSSNSFSEAKKLRTSACSLQTKELNFVSKISTYCILFVSFFQVCLRSPLARKLPVHLKPCARPVDWPQVPQSGQRENQCWNSFRAKGPLVTIAVPQKPKLHLKFKSMTVPWQSILHVLIPLSKCHTSSHHISRSIFRMSCWRASASSGDLKTKKVRCPRKSDTH